MAYSVRIYNFSHGFALKNKYFYPLLSNQRFFCSKDGDSKTSGSVAENSSPEEKGNKESKGKSKLKTSRFKRAPISNETKEAAKQKLMSLLSNIKITSENNEKSSSSLNLAKPLKRISKKERLKQMEAEQNTEEKEMKTAVKAVASSFKADPEKIESELSEKLSALKLTKEVKDTTEAPELDTQLNENLMSSVGEVATTISESPIPPRSELAKRLMRLSLDEKVKLDEKKSVRSVIEGMAIQEPSVKKAQVLSPDQAASVEGKRRDTTARLPPFRKVPKPQKVEHINLFGGIPLNIFAPDTEEKPDSVNSLWRKLEEREVRLATQFAPANAFEEMIMWTEQGKHWKFPIDNQTEMGVEENTGFHEHVFLEKHLEGFPTKGPIRHFMELVCVGLSKNPYITVERKVENIEWFRNYFKEKEEILRDAGAIE